MATFRPFKAVRPIPPKAKDIASLPYDVMDSEEAREEVKRNPLSFMHVEKAEVDLPADIDHYDQRVYDKARENLYNYLKEGLMMQDQKPMFYIYRQIMNGHEQYGLVGCTSVDEYMQGIIKKHELTRAEKEADRIRHVDTCDAHSSPVFFTYHHKEEIDEIVNRVASGKPVYDFVADDGIAHTLWLVDQENDIKGIEDNFAKLQYLYVADGHHRTASAAKVGLMRREQHPDYTGEEEFNFFMAVIFPDNQLKIMDYNRIVKDLHGHSDAEFLDLVMQKFDLAPYSENEPYHPQATHEFGMYFDGMWYKMTAKPNTFSTDSPVKMLDVTILQENLLAPILGIGDPRRDTRIDFVGGIRGLAELQKRVDSGRDAVAFAMYPTSMDELMDIADAGEIMPPKSTWFEPKLRDGILFHSLE
jgi:uncharacterized protein (DUF1015 family)